MRIRLRKWARAHHWFIEALHQIGNLEIAFGQRLSARTLAGSRASHADLLLLSEALGLIESAGDIFRIVADSHRSDIWQR